MSMKEFLHEKATLEQQYQDGLITEYEYLIKLQMLCSMKLMEMLQRLT